MKPVLLTTLAVLALGRAASAQAPAPGPGYQTVQLPTAAGPGKPIESRVVADTAHVKSAVIILRQGATLSEHSSLHPVAIQALSGQGQLRLDKKLEKLAPTQMVLLDPGVKHEVIADKGTDLVLLVHHLKAASPRKAAPPAAAPHHH
jgi:quercetin dioxygenase-like cupin family protein